MRKGLVVGVATLALLLGLVPSALAASPATFGVPTATSTYGEGIDFGQAVVVDVPVGRTELLLTVADAIGPEVVEVSDRPRPGATTLSYTLDTSGPAHLIPNTRITAQWRLFSADDPTKFALGPALTVVYEDDRFAWQTVSGELARVHWYKGDAAFGAKALRLAEDAIRETADLLGVIETESVDFFVYAYPDDFYGALGPGAHENVAGTAYASIRTLLGLIPPGEIDDPLVAVRIPHEFVHLVFDTASSNPYHRPPRWLNEGLAVYQSEGYAGPDRGAVKNAARSGSLIPLDGLTGQFPNGRDFFLAYSESVAAVDFIVRTYGPNALVTLIRSYADGRTDDEAFTDALGLDMTAFGSAWFADVGATEPTKDGPRPAPRGPVPAAWEGTGGLISTPAPGAANPGPGARPSSDASTANDASPAREGPDWLIPLALLIGVAIVVGVILGRRRRASAGGPA